MKSLDEVASISIADAAALMGGNPVVEDFIDAILEVSYEDFILNLYKKIDRIIQELQESAELIKDDKEDRLNVSIKMMLRMRGYAATHDEKIRGHTDLVVRKSAFVWIGEAKIHRGNAVLMDGFNQLTTRYSNGDVGSSCGGMILYIDGENAAAIMEAWKTHLAAEALPDFRTNACVRRPLSFFSTHRHSVSGTDYVVRHMPVLRRHKPLA